MNCKERGALSDLVFAVPSAEHVKYSMHMRPLPPAFVLERVNVWLCVRRDRQNVDGRVFDRERLARLLEPFGHASVERLEPLDEVGFTGRTVGSKLCVFRVREERHVLDVVRSQEARSLTVGGFVAGACQELGNPVRNKRGSVISVPLASERDRTIPYAAVRARCRTSLARFVSSLWSIARHEGGADP